MPTPEQLTPTQIVERNKKQKLESIMMHYSEYVAWGKNWLARVTREVEEQYVKDAAEAETVTPELIETGDGVVVV